MRTLGLCHDRRPDNDDVGSTLHQEHTLLHNQGLRGRCVRCAKSRPYCPVLAGTCADVKMWDKYGPQRTKGCFMKLEVGIHGVGGGVVRIFPHFPHFSPHFPGRSLSVMFKRKHSSGIVL